MENNVILHVVISVLLNVEISVKMAVMYSVLNHAVQLVQRPVVVHVLDNVMVVQVRHIKQLLIK